MGPFQSGAARFAGVSCVAGRRGNADEIVKDSPTTSGESVGCQVRGDEGALARSEALQEGDHGQGRGDDGEARDSAGHGKE